MTTTKKRSASTGKFESVKDGKGKTIVVEYKVGRDSCSGKFVSAKQERSLTGTRSEKNAMSAAKSLAHNKGLKK